MIVSCEVCDKQINRAPAALARQKHVTCNNECKAKLKTILSAPIGSKRISFYGYVLVKTGRGSNGWQFEHRLLADAPVVHHDNHIKTDNTEGNLIGTTRAEHIRLHHSGEESHFAVYTEEQIMQVLDLHASGMGQNRISHATGVKQSTVTKIVRQESWVSTYNKWVALHAN